jgi:hypothetical protein
MPFLFFVSCGGSGIGRRLAVAFLRPGFLGFKLASVSRRALGVALGRIV